MKTYTYNSNLGRGGFGRVEKVIGSDGLAYAKKIFDPAPGILNNPDIDITKLRKRFIREYRTQKELNSEYIFPVLEADLSGLNPYFIMPLADKSFEEQIKEDKKNGQINFNALFDILNGLEHLHELGFTHRDLKPGNVLLYQGVWRITDFGLIQINSTDTTQLSSIHSAWGSLHYCAPEQASNFKSVNHLVDIYAFGCVVHDYYGTRPQYRVPYAKQTAPGDAGIFIEKCTDEKPSKRFQNISITRSALSKLQTSLIIPNNPELKDWLEKIKNFDVNGWAEDDLKKLILFLNHSEPNDLTFIYNVIESSFIHSQSKFDLTDFTELALGFTDYVSSNSFGWDYCDVLMNKLDAFYQEGDLKIKAAVALSAAELAKSHNRWYVMKHVLKMCGKDIDPKLAQRIALEIKVNDSEDNFIACAERLARFTIEDYHPYICSVLKLKQEE